MFDEKLVNRINMLYSNDKETAEKIIKGDADTIRQMTFGSVFSSEMIVYAFKNGKEKELFEEAKRQEEIKRLYYDILDQYNTNTK